MSSPTNGHVLAHLAGEWLGQEQIFPTPWGPGGAATASVSARNGPTEAVLLQEYQAKRDGALWLTAHAVFTYAAQNDGYALFWFDSLGFTPVEPALGTWDGAVLRFLRTSPRGQTRHSYTFPSANTYSLTLESSFDGGATWVSIAEGRYIRRTL